MMTAVKTTQQNSFSGRISQLLELFHHNQKSDVIRKKGCFCMRDNFSCSFWFVNQIVTLVSTKSGTIVGLQTRVYIATVIVIHASAGWKAHLPSYTKWTNVYNLLFFHPSQARCLFCSPVGSILTSVAAVRVVITELVLSGCSSCALLHSWTGAWK